MAHTQSCICVKSVSPASIARCKYSLRTFREYSSTGKRVSALVRLFRISCQLSSIGTKVTVVDPNMFCLNVIQDTIVESERDAKNAQFVIGGYMRAEGCLRKVKAAAYID